MRRVVTPTYEVNDLTSGYSYTYSLCEEKWAINVEISSYDMRTNDWDKIKAYTLKKFDTDMGIFIMEKQRDVISGIVAEHEQSLPLLFNIVSIVDYENTCPIKQNVKVERVLIYEYYALADKRNMRQKKLEVSY